MRQEEHIAAVQKMAKVGTWEVDLLNDNLFWSDQTYIIHETTPTEYRPNIDTSIQFYAPEGVPIISSAIEKAITESKGFDLELEIITKKISEFGYMYTVV
jgi:hypothetical protein